ncbi:MAG: nucleotidyltransferase [Acidobacteria bacterium]|nr:MAG: nucleotidyltransferase [Acidobacteriota bacterium]
MTKIEALSQQFERAILRLDEVLRLEKNEFMRDSAIKRFEITFDLSWKAVKAYLEEIKGVPCASPKGCFREAYRQGMTDLRNQAVHIYKEELAEQIYRVLPRALSYFQRLSSKLNKNASCG